MELHLPLEGIGTKPGVYKTQGFGEHGQDYSPLLGHNGIDWAAPKGTPIMAAHDGFVTMKFDTNATGQEDGYGTYARVQWDEDGFTYDTVYGHFDKHAGVDRPVKAGDVIGYADSTGFSTGSHLHFGIRKKLNGSVVDYYNGYAGYFDPMPFFKEEIMAIELIRDNGTVYLVSGVNTKVKTGIANPDVLSSLFGDAPIIDGDTSSIPQTKVLAPGMIIHNV